MKKPPATLPAATAIWNPKPTIEQPYWLLKSNTCKKLGVKAVGGISYQLLGDSERQNLYVRITANFGGGYFSREIVPFSAVKACLDRREADKPFPSKLFKEAFIGLSSNNAGFMAAILRAEGLLSLAPDTETQHIVAADWTEFVKTMLAVPGEKIEIEMPMPVKDQSESPPAANVPAQTKTTKTLTLKRPKAETPADTPDKTGD
jgi:hypothetical protein